MLLNVMPLWIATVTGAPVLAATSTTDLSAFLEGAGTLLTKIFGTWVPEVVTAIMGNGILAIGFYVFVISVTVGFILRIAGSR